MTVPKEEQVKKILDSCMEAGWNMRSMPIVFTGGTAYLLREEITRLMPSVETHEIGSDIRFVNVRGFLAAIAG